MSDSPFSALGTRGLRRFYVRVVLLVTVVTAATVALSAAAVWYAERNAARANIHDYGTAVWWSMETVTTVSSRCSHSSVSSTTGWPNSSNTRPPER